MAVTQGLWNVGGVNVPDLGISENPVVQALFPSASGVNNSSQNTSQWSNGGVDYSQVVTTPQGVAIKNPGVVVPAGGTQQQSQPQQQSSGQTDQQKWEAAGHPGQAPVGYHGEAGGGGVDEAAINSVYEPTMNYLNQAESQVRADLPTALESVQRAYESAIAELTAGKTKNLGTIATNEKTVGQQKEDALSAARRLYNELRQGYQQRFGGSTSAGQAASELSAVEQQRQMGQTTRDYATAVQAINQQKLQLDQDYQTGQAKIQEQKTLALQQAQQNFTQALLQIQSQRAQTESQKAAAKLDALNQLKAQAYQTQQQAIQYQQNLDMFYKQQQADLQTYAQKLNMSGTNAGNAANAYKTPPPTSTLQVAQGGTTNPQLAGSIKKDELLQGYTQSNLNPNNLLSKIGLNYGN
jgi:hypothetical protein